MFIEKNELDAEESEDCKQQEENNSNYFDGESDNDAKPSLENVEMLLDKNNFVYYMTKSQGVCTIREINP